MHQRDRILKKLEKIVEHWCGDPLARIFKILSERSRDFSVRSDDYTEDLIDGILLEIEGGERGWCDGCKDLCEVVFPFVIWRLCAHCYMED